MLRNPPGILAVISDEHDQAVLATVELSVDFAPADEHVQWLEMLRQLRLDPRSAARSAALVEFRPRWTQAGQPNIAGFKLHAGDVSAEWDLLYFAAAVNLARQRSAEGDPRLARRLTVRLQAQEREKAARPRGVPPSLAVARRSLPHFAGDDASTPVVIDAAVVAETREAAEASPACEVGGLLLGRHLVDPADGRMALEVTRAVRATRAQSDVSSFRLTHEAWGDLRRQIAQLGLPPEVAVVGWWHTHPVKSFCPNCPAERRKDCALQGRFFSQADQRVHRTFLRPSSVGLLFTVADARTDVDVFGWVAGEVAWRTWHECLPDGSLAAHCPPEGKAVAAEPVAEGDDCHAS